MAKSRKRQLAARKGWRKKRRKANPVKRRRRRRRNPPAGYVKSSRSGGASWPVKKKRKKYKKRKSSTRRRRRSSRKRVPYTRKKGYRPSRSRRAAALKGWARRRRGHRRKTKSGSYSRLRTSRGYRYKQPRKKRGAYRYYRNPKHYIRMKNPDSVKDILMPIALGVGGLALAGILMSKLPANIKAKIPTVAGINLGVLVPGVVGFLVAKYLTKKMPAQAKLLYGLGFGLMLASGIGLYNAFAPKAGLPAVGMAGYVVSPFSGYVTSRSMSGYVRSGGALGQLEERVPRTLGDSVMYRGATPPVTGVPMKRALAYQPKAVVPYGLGVPREERRYNDFSWRGVYKNSVYEK